MPITFRHDAAAVGVPLGSSATRKYGQSLVLQQQQQKYQGQQAGYDRQFRLASQIGQNQFQMGRDQNENFQGAMDNISTRAQELLTNNKIPPALAPEVQNLLSDRMKVLGSGYNETQQQEFLKGFNSRLAGILSNVPPEWAGESQENSLKQFLGPRYDKLKDRNWVPDGNGRFVELPDQKQQPAAPPPPPTTARDVFRADPKTRKEYVDVATKIYTKGGETMVTADDRAAINALAIKLYEQDQSDFGPAQPTQSPAAPSAVGAQSPSVPTSAQSPGAGFVYEGTPNVGSQRMAGSPAQAPARDSNAWLQGLESQVVANNAEAAPVQGAVKQYNEDFSQKQAQYNQQAAGQDRSQSAIDDAAAWKKRNPGQSFNAEQMQYMRDRGVDDSDIQSMQDTGVGYVQGERKTQQQRGQEYDQAAAARGNRVPIDPSGPYSRDEQGKPYDGRVNSTYSISGAQAERDQKMLDEMKADGDAYKARRAANDAKLTDRKTNTIEDPKQLKRDAQQFTADYNIYKRGGGSLSTRDYIRQRAAEGTLSGDLTRQLQENYNMDLSEGGIKDVVEQDLSGPRAQAMDDAKAKRGAEDKRRKYARDRINEKRGYRAPASATPPRVAVPTTPPAATPAAQGTPNPKLKRGLPGGTPTAESTSQAISTDSVLRKAVADYDTYLLGGGKESRKEWALRTQADSVNTHLAQEGWLPALGAGGQNAAGATPTQTKAGPTEKLAPKEMIKQSGLPESPKPNWTRWEQEAEDDEDRMMMRHVRARANGQPPDVANALYVAVNPSASVDERRAASKYLMTKGIDLRDVLREQQADTARAARNSYIPMT